MFSLLTIKKNFRYRESELNRATAEQRKRELDVQAAQHEEQANNVEGDLKVEREWRVSLQECIQLDREKISKLQHELSHLKAVAQVSNLEKFNFFLFSCNK